MKFAYRHPTVTPSTFLLSLFCLMTLTAPLPRANAQTVAGTVTLEGCAAPAQSVTFAFSSATKSYFFTRTVTLNADGSYVLPDLPADTYHVKIKGAKWLAAVSDVTVSAGTAALNAALSTGDANNDNACDATDFGLLTSAYNTNGSNSNYDPNCDLNCDGFVDATDLSLLLGDYDSVGDELPAGSALPLSKALFCNSLDFVPDPNNPCCMDYPEVLTRDYFRSYQFRSYQ